ncbi:MAG: hypothetical protein KDD85_09280 [Parvularculaceae bacterium]|nr:hypothetical protein [Parvularculaceae bacterium]
MRIILIGACLLWAIPAPAPVSAASAGPLVRLCTAGGVRLIRLGEDEEPDEPVRKGSGCHAARPGDERIDGVGAFRRRGQSPNGA